MSRGVAETGGVTRGAKKEDSLCSPCSSRRNAPPNVAMAGGEGVGGSTKKKRPALRYKRRTWAWKEIAARSNQRPFQKKKEEEKGQRAKKKKRKRAASLAFWACDGRRDLEKTLQLGRQSRLTTRRERRDEITQCNNQHCGWGWVDWGGGNRGGTKPACYMS